MKGTLQYCSTSIKKNPVDAVILFFCTAVFILENMHGRLWMNDFRVYYSAAADLLKGNEIYGKLYVLGSGNYKYSPFAAMIFIPFALLPYAIAKTVLFFMSTAATVLLFKQLAVFIKTSNKVLSSRNINIILFSVFAAALAHLFRELHLGNVNMILLFILFSAMLALEKNELNAGVLIAFCMLLKPHFVLLLPLLILRKKYKAILCIAALLIAGFLLPALFTGWEQNAHLFSEWIETMKEHSVTLESAGQNVAFILQTNFFSNSSLHFYSIIEAATVAAFALLILFLFIKHLVLERKNGTVFETGHFRAEFILLLAMIPSLTITDTEHFLFSIPIIAMLVTFAFEIEKRKSLYVSILIFALVLYGGNLHDLIGAKLSEKIFSLGILGIGNVLLILLFVFRSFAKGVRK